MLPAEINQRRQALRLSKKDFADLAGLDETTVGRVLAGKRGSYVATITKLSNAIIEAEQRELRRLLELHGLPQAEAA